MFQGFGNSAATNSSPFGQTTFGAKPGGVGGTGTGFGGTAFGGGTSGGSLFGGGGVTGQTGVVGGQTTGGLFGSAAGTTPAFGQTQTSTPSFGGFTGTGGGLFGSQPQAGATNVGATGGGLFGAAGSTAAGTSAFGTQAKTGFGAFGTAASGQTTGGGLFSQGAAAQQTQQTPLFGGTAATAGGSGLFGSSTGSFGAATSAAGGGTTIKFTPVTGSDTMVKSGQTTTINTRHHCITCMKEYEAKSLEELRLEDYAANRKGPQQGVQSGGLFGAAPQPSLFGSNAIGSTPTTGSLFSNTATSGGSIQKEWPCNKYTFNIGKTNSDNDRKVLKIRENMGSTKKSQHTYEQSLSFSLNNTPSTKIWQNLPVQVLKADRGQLTDDNDNSTMQVEAVYRTTSFAEERELLDKIGKDLLNLFRESNEKRQQEQDNLDDEDRLFLMSLVKDLKNIPPQHMKLSAKRQILMVVEQHQPGCGIYGDHGYQQATPVASTSTNLKTLNNLSMNASDMKSITGINEHEGATKSVTEMNVNEEATKSLTEINVLGETAKSVTEMNVNEEATKLLTEMNVLGEAAKSVTEMNVNEEATKSLTEINVLEEDTESITEMNVHQEATKSKPEINVLEEATKSKPEINVHEDDEESNNLALTAHSVSGLNELEDDQESDDDFIIALNKLETK